MIEVEGSSNHTLGYFVPEDAWNELEEATCALNAIGDLANHAPERMNTNSERIKSLIGLFQTKLTAVRDSGEFCVRPMGG